VGEVCRRYEPACIGELVLASTFYTIDDSTNGTAVAQSKDSFGQDIRVLSNPISVKPRTTLASSLK
jgi:hypothetical protein